MSHQRKFPNYINGIWMNYDEQSVSHDDKHIYYTAKKMPPPPLPETTMTSWKKHQDFSRRYIFVHGWNFPANHVSVGCHIQII